MDLRSLNVISGEGILLKQSLTVLKENIKLIKGIFDDFYFRIVIIVLSLFFAFVYNQSMKRKIKKICKKTHFNIDILNNINKTVSSYKPCIYIPFEFMSMLREIRTVINKVKLKTEMYRLPDKGELRIEYFPESFDEMVSTTPIIIFNFGSAGSSDDFYFQNLCNIVKKKGWRIVAFNRRGFGNTNLKSPVFLQKNEEDDLHHFLTYLKSKHPQTSFYMTGVSMGANFGTKYLGRYGKTALVKAFCGISNPFNLGRLSFVTESNIVSLFYSKIIASGIKEIFKSHSENQYFQRILKQQRITISCIEKLLKRRTSFWEVDKYITYRFGGYRSVYDYHYHISSENFLDGIEVPTLFINNKNDPICWKEIIPYDKIHHNENTILLLTERGGHVGYFSGWNADWWAYETAMSYFQYFENKTSAKRK